jgi:uncharacterized protein (DUF952 family)
MPDITIEQAQAIAERWLTGDGATRAGVYEFDHGYVVYPRGPRPEASDESPPARIGTARGVIDKLSGDLSMWPCVPPEAVADLYRRHQANQGPVYHIAFAADWTAARAAGEYLVSTRGATLADLGFIHASFAHQVPVVAAAAYADVTESLVVLVIDPRQLMAELRVDAEFPHIYGPLNTDAVIDVVPLADFG